MKTCSAAALAILSGGEYFRINLYDITLITGATYHLCDYENGASLQAAVYPGPTNTYTTGITITRGSTTQEVGLDAQELELTMSPKWDAINGPTLIGGYSLIQAARVGLLDNAEVLFSKMYLNPPTGVTPLDTSPGGIPWFSGIVTDIDPITRSEIVLKVSSDLVVLNQVQMPKNLYQANCVHTLYDAGCTLSKAAFTNTGGVTYVTSTSQFNIALAKPNGYYQLGQITFTSGANAGLSSTIKSHTAAGVLTLADPFPVIPAVNDTFVIYPGCDHTLNSCINKFNNLSHNKSTPFVPVPETLYDGGTSNPPLQSNLLGSQGNRNIKSYTSGNILP